MTLGRRLSHLSLSGTDHFESPFCLAEDFSTHLCFSSFVRARQLKIAAEIDSSVDGFVMSPKESRRINSGAEQRLEREECTRER